MCLLQWTLFEHASFSLQTPTYTGNRFLDFYSFYSDSSSNTSRTTTSSGGLVNETKPRKTFSHEYRTLNCIGKGGFGQVYDGRRRSDNASVVIKFLPRDRILNWGTFEGVRKDSLSLVEQEQVLSMFRNVCRMKSKFSGVFVVCPVSYAY